MNVCVVGAGFVGLTTGIVFAEHGHDVTVVEAIPEKLETLLAGKVPFHEPGVSEALTAQLARGTIQFTGDLTSAVRNSEATYLCVGTPQGEDGSIDLQYIKAAAAQVGAALAEGDQQHTVVVKSTVVPGTAADVVRPAVAEASGRNVPVASNPEFLKEGSAIEDARNPDRIVIGADGDSVDGLWILYEDFDCPKLTVSTRTAEMIKYAANSFLAVKIAFANELANAAERMGVDWEQVVAGIGHDERINPRFFAAGLGFGGSCFPKDVAALAFAARSSGAPSGVLEASLDNNKVQPMRGVELLEQSLGPLANKRIALLGLAFKANTDDVRETRAIPLLDALRGAGADVICHDPHAAETFQALVPDASIASSIGEALAGADAFIVQTDWQEYQDLAPTFAAQKMKGRTVVDGRRALNPRMWRDAGFDYRAIGLGTS